MNKEQQLRLLRQCIVLMANKNVSNQNSILEWTKIIHFAHKKGYLYCGFDNGDVVLCCIAYKVKEVTDSTGDQLPDKEEGNILYACSAASKAKDSRKLFNLMRWYLRENEEVTQLAYHRRNSDDLVIRSIHGKEKFSLNS